MLKQSPERVVGNVVLGDDGKSHSLNLTVRRKLPSDFFVLTDLMRYGGIARPARQVAAGRAVNDLAFRVQ